jgi:hypothetical protein
MITPTLNRRQGRPGAGKAGSMLAWAMVTGLALTACLGIPSPAAQPAATAAPPTAATVAPATTAAPAATKTPAAPAPTTAVNSQASPTVALPAAPVLSSDEVIQAVKAAWEAYAKAGPVRLNQTSSMGGNPTLTIKAEIVPPDQLHQVTSMMGQAVAEQYFYGGAIYGESPGTGGTWVKTPNFGVKQFATVVSSLAGDATLTRSDGKVLGVENVNSEAAMVYGYSSQLQGFPDKISYKLWVSQSRGLPLKFEKDPPKGDQMVQEFTYDPALKIVLPAEVAAAPTAVP